MEVWAESAGARYTRECGRHGTTRPSAPTARVGAGAGAAAGGSPGRLPASGSRHEVVSAHAQWAGPSLGCGDGTPAPTLPLDPGTMSRAPSSPPAPPPPPVPSPLAGALPPARGRQNQSFEKRRPSLGAASPRGSGPLGTLPSQGSRLQAQDTLGTPPSSEQSHLGGEVALAGAVWGQRASKGPVVAAGPVLGAWWAEWPPRPRAQGRADRGTAGASRRQSWACPGPAAPEQVVRLGPHPPPHPMLRAPHRPRHSTPPPPELRPGASRMVSPVPAGTTPLQGTSVRERRSVLTKRFPERRLDFVRKLIGLPVPSGVRLGPRAASLLKHM